MAVGQLEQALVRTQPRKGNTAVQTRVAHGIDNALLFRFTLAIIASVARDGDLELDR